MQVTAYKQDGTKAGKVILPDEVFKVSENKDLLAQAVRVLTARSKRPVAHTKTRSEVRGGGRKPWRQKGTGRARHGSIRSPIWRGGGVTFGPRRDEVGVKYLPKRMRLKALAVALSEKVRDGELAVLDNLELPEAKTKHMAEIVESVTKKAFDIGSAKRVPSVLIALAKRDTDVAQASRNIPRLAQKPASDISVLDVLQSRYILLEKGAIAPLTSRIVKKDTATSGPQKKKETKKGDKQT